MNGNRPKPACRTSRRNFNCGGGRINSQEGENAHRPVLIARNKTIKSTINLPTCVYDGENAMEDDATLFSKNKKEHPKVLRRFVSEQTESSSSTTNNDERSISNRRVNMDVKDLNCNSLEKNKNIKQNNRKGDPFKSGNVEDKSMLLGQIQHGLKLKSTKHLMVESCPIVASASCLNIPKYDQKLVLSSPNTLSSNLKLKTKRFDGMSQTKPKICRPPLPPKPKIGLSLDVDSSSKYKSSNNHCKTSNSESRTRVNGQADDVCDGDHDESSDETDGLDSKGYINNKVSGQKREIINNKSRSKPIKGASEINLSVKIKSDLNLSSTQEDVSPSSNFQQSKKLLSKLFGNRSHNNINELTKQTDSKSNVHNRSAVSTKSVNKDDSEHFKNVFRHKNSDNSVQKMNLPPSIKYVDEDDSFDECDDNDKSTGPMTSTPVNQHPDEEANKLKYINTANEKHKYNHFDSNINHSDGRKAKSNNTNHKDTRQKVDNIQSEEDSDTDSESSESDANANYIYKNKHYNKDNDNKINKNHRIQQDHNDNDIKNDNYVKNKNANRILTESSNKNAKVSSVTNTPGFSTATLKRPTCPPPLPPHKRPLKKLPSFIKEFESRFTFHDLSNLPPPHPFKKDSTSSVITNPALRLVNKFNKNQTYKKSPRSDPYETTV